MSRIVSLYYSNCNPVVPSVLMSMAVRDIGCYQDPGCAEKSEDHGVALYVVGSLCSGVDLK